MWRFFNIQLKSDDLKIEIKAYHNNFLYLQREYAEKMLSSADDEVPREIKEKLLSLLQPDDEEPKDRIIII